MEIRNPYGEISKILNSKQSNAVIVSGRIYDLFYDGTRYSPLIPCITNKSTHEKVVHITYELNRALRFNNPLHTNVAEVQWKAFYGIKNDDTSFGDYLKASERNPTIALEFLRRLSECFGKSDYKLLVIIESADMLIPNTQDITNHIAFNRISIMYDWLNNLSFIEGNSSVIMLTESLSLLNNKIAKLPHLSMVEVKYPTADDRQHYMQYLSGVMNIPLDTVDINHTAGLTLYHIRQLCLRAKCESRRTTSEEIINKIEDLLSSQLGSETIEFKRPKHKISDLIGYTKLKRFLLSEFIPRVQEGGKYAMSGAAVAGPIGSGKTYIFEAVAAEVGIPVIVLKNIRSQWFGQTDVMFESLRAILESLDKVLIFVDEADTQFGGVGQDVHDTERRLTGKVQSMMSDSKLKGKVFWLLMTARIDKLSPDIRRHGRAGDLIIPVLDPDGDDRQEFIEWILGSYRTDELVKLIDSKLPANTSSASFAYLKSTIAYQVDLARRNLPAAEPLSVITNLLDNYLEPPIAKDRGEQIKQAVINCTRKDLLSDKALDLRNHILAKKEY